MESNWDFYFANVNDKLSSIFVDLGFAQVAPLEEKPWLAYILLRLKAPREDGLSINEEAPTLYAIQDALEPALLSIGSTLVGRITGDGDRDFYFYASAMSEFDDVVKRVMNAFPGYEYQSGCKEDPEWNQYFDVLYPSERDMQRISNRHVLESLEKHGDRHDVPREVDHVIYFQAEEGRSKCKAILAEDGYEMTGEEEGDDSQEGRRYSLMFKRVDSVVWDRINEITLELYELALKFEGDYDGWGCEVQKAE